MWDAQPWGWVIGVEVSGTLLCREAKCHLHRCLRFIQKVYKTFPLIKETSPISACGTIFGGSSIHKWISFKTIAPVHLLIVGKYSKLIYCEGNRSRNFWCTQVMWLEQIITLGYKHWSYLKSLVVSFVIPFNNFW